MCFVCHLPHIVINYSYVKVRDTGVVGGLAPTHSHLGCRRRWVETNTPPVALPPGKRPDIYCTGGWVHPRTGLDSTVAPTAIRCPAVQPVTSHYTNYAVFGRGLNGYGHLKHLCLSLFLSVVTLRARECKPYYSNSFFNILRIIVIHGDFQQGILFL